MLQRLAVVRSNNADSHSWLAIAVTLNLALADYILVQWLCFPIYRFK